MPNNERDAAAALAASQVMLPPASTNSYEWPLAGLNNCCPMEKVIVRVAVLTEALEKVTARSAAW